MKRIFTVFSAVAVLAMMIGCSSQPADNPQASTADASSDKQLPFDGAPKKGLLSGGSLLPKEVNVAAGTPITVRLQN
ncbi:MAG: hypothetical protein JOY79_06700, partial [Acidobacteriaceae bacterium]|nr:hypothetical protein [Acidobacteriaceae bacterium]